MTSIQRNKRLGTQRIETMSQLYLQLEQSVTSTKEIANTLGIH